MNLKATIPTAILAGIMVLSIFACCSTASAEATPPSWEEGDAWAMGFEKDLGAEYADEILNLTGQLENFTDQVGLEVDNFDADGNVEFYLVFEVTEDDGTYYTLTADMGQKFLFSLDVEISGDLPKEGTNFSDGEMEEKTLSAEITLKYALWTHADVQVNKSTMAIESIDIEVHGSVIVDADIQNLPNLWETLDNEGTDEVPWSYQSIDIWMSMDVNIGISIDFEPALDVFQFPFNVGDEWHVESNATISGSVDGFIDATGLPPEAEDQIFSQDFLVANGVNSFPIELDQLDNDEDDGPPITNGQLEETTENIEFDVACVGSKLVTLPNYGAVNVYTLEVDGEKFYYSPDIKFMTSMDVDFEELFGDSGIDIPVDIPEGLMEEDDASFGSVDASVAKSNIQEIEDYQGSISEEAEDGPSTGDDINDFFFKEPYFGIIIIVLVVVVVISVVFAAVKRK